jgi:hypothetical protein
MQENVSKADTVENKPPLTFMYTLRFALNDYVAESTKSQSKSIHICMSLFNSEFFWPVGAEKLRQDDALVGNEANWFC